MANSYIAAGELDAAEGLIGRVANNPAAPPLKAAGYLNDYRRLRETVPAVAAAWHAVSTRVEKCKTTHENALTATAHQEISCTEKGVCENAPAELPLIQY